MIRNWWKVGVVMLGLLATFVAGFGGGAWWTTRIIVYRATQDWPLDAERLTSHLSDIRAAKSDAAVANMERELAIRVMAMKQNEPLWPESDKARLARAMGWAKLYFISYPATADDYSADLNASLSKISTSECKDGKCSESLLRLLPGHQAAVPAPAQE